MGRKIIPIHERELAAASDDLEPTLYMIYEKYGADITRLTLQYMIAKTIAYEEGLTASDKSALIKQSSSGIQRFTRLLSNYLSSGLKD